jgi:oligosaccharide 4-alpha-D-glucosyltransferase
MSLFGLAYTHSDLGGFAEGKEFDKELYIRWLQYGVFHPLFRPHGQEHIPSEPVFHDRETRDIARELIRLRYRLLPYNYTLAYENSTSGMPLARPLFFENESDKALIDEKDAYFWGNAFLVAPVTDAGIDAVDIDLPSGTWFDFWDGTRYEGSRSVSLPVTLETIPVLVRGGSFVPMVDVVESTMAYSSENLTLHYYADESVTRSEGRIYEDDGASRTSLEENRYELLHFTANRRDNTLGIAMQRDGEGYDGMPAERELTFIVHNWPSEISSLHIGKTGIPLNRELPRSGNAASYDSDARKLTVRVKWDHLPAEIRIE